MKFSLFKNMIALSGLIVSSHIAAEVISNSKISIELPSGIECNPKVHKVSIRNSFDRKFDLDCTQSVRVPTGSYKFVYGRNFDVDYSKMNLVRPFSVTFDQDKKIFFKRVLVNESVCVNRDENDILGSFLGNSSRFIRFKCGDIDKYVLPTGEYKFFPNFQEFKELDKLIKDYSKQSISFSLDFESDFNLPLNGLEFIGPEEEPVKFFRGHFLPAKERVIYPIFNGRYHLNYQHMYKRIKISSKVDVVKEKIGKVIFTLKHIERDYPYMIYDPKLFILNLDTNKKIHNRVLTLSKKEGNYSVDIGSTLELYLYPGDYSLYSNLVSINFHKIRDDEIERNTFDVSDSNITHLDIVTNPDRKKKTNQIKDGTWSHLRILK